VTIDSAKGNEFFGRLTRALAGDVEMSANFRPFRGLVGTDSVARIRIDGVNKDISAITIAGSVGVEAWGITSVVWGEELVTQKTKWSARKQKT
jgi:hypothetical protein